MKATEAVVPVPPSVADPMTGAEGREPPDEFDPRIGIRLVYLTLALLTVGLADT